MSAFGLSPHPMFKELSSLSSTRQSLAFHKADVGHTRIVAVAMSTGRDVPGGGGGGGGGGFPPSTFTQGTALNMYGGPSSISDSTPSSSSFASSSPYAFTPSRILPELPPAIHLSHAPPSVPSTFLPSYYPEGRHTDHTLPSSSFAGASASTSSSPIYPSMPSPRSSFSAIPPPPRAQGLEYGGASRDLHEAYHRLSQSGPSSEHLLDGVNMSPPRAPRPVAIPTYEFSPGSLPAVLPEAKPWLPKEREWQEISLFDQLLGGGGGGSGSNPSATGNTAGGDAAQGNLHGITTVGVGTGSGVNGQGQGQGQGQFASGSNTSSRRESDIGAGLPPIQSGNFARDYSMSEGIPKSAGYPGMMYGSVALPDGSLPSPTLGTSDGDLFVGPDEYAQALGIYEHILSALPHIRPSTAPMPEDQSAPAYDTLLQLASDGTSLLSGIAPARRSSTTGTPGSVRRGSGTGTNAVGTGKLLGKRANGDTKKATKCLGCGATETPEWRRGPLGPRTLCNACGLVHMKMLRRQKREAERAQAKSGQASGSGK